MKLRVPIKTTEPILQRHFKSIYFPSILEIQKLAGQIQYVKVVGMLMDNHHIKNPKKDGYFSKENFVKNMGLSDCTGSGEGSTTANGDLPSAGSSQKPKKKRHSIFSVSTYKCSM